MTNNCNSFISKIEIQNESMQWNYSWNLRDLISFLDPKDYCNQLSKIRIPT